MAGGGDELKLLGLWASPFVLRVKLALSIKGLSYEDVEEDIFGGKSELLLNSNPVHKKVPVLLHNGKPICDSQIIVQYIDEAFAGSGPSLLPIDPLERAVARFWAAYVDDNVQPHHQHQAHDNAAASMIYLHADLIKSKMRVLQLLASWLQSSKSKTEEEKAEAFKQTLMAVENMEKTFKECSKGKPFFGGDSVGYLDVTLGGLVAWLHTAEKLLHGVRLFDATRSPLLEAWLERFGELEAVKAVLPDVDSLVEYAKQRQAAEAAAAADAGGN
ncbi:hypothetical protein PR202_gb07280 [Eleusine coracana subsp. coracana]|uniref:glutathione transferase n=1 Tax=Eleusine coracana subsp. coracana TaxID=191504 RepID=A0AAV5ECK2_ELECO|nr:hypothetical protein PR202_gb07280 [Eleusine coracana subsp. coracana]